MADKSKSKSSFRSSSIKDDGPYMLEKGTMADLKGLLAALNNVTSTPEGAVKFNWSESNLNVELTGKGDQSASTVTCVFISVQGGRVSAHTGDIKIANIQDFD